MFVLDLLLKKTPGRVVSDERSDSKANEVSPDNPGADNHDMIMKLVTSKSSNGAKDDRTDNLDDKQGASFVKRHQTYKGKACEYSQGATGKYKTKSGEVVEDNSQYNSNHQASDKNSSELSAAEFSKVEPEIGEKSCEKSSDNKAEER